MLHRHRYTPDLAQGEAADGSARIWACSCGATIEYLPLPIDIAAQHVYDDIREHGLRSTR